MQTHACLFFDRFVLLCRQGLFLPVASPSTLRITAIEIDETG
jgi:hypothetical protein